MARHPDFEGKSVEEKLNFLHDWCEGMNKSLQQLGSQVRNLHERVNKVEGPVADDRKA